MESLTERSNLRRRAKRAYREYRAILVLLNALTGKERDAIDRSLRRLPTLSRPKLREIYTKVQEELLNLKGKVGAKADLSAYEGLLRNAPPLGNILYVAKFEIQRKYFDRYERVFPVFASLPPHAWIGIDPHGILKHDSPGLNFRLLEATLFEEMALLWNATTDARAELGRAKSTIASKWFGALLRATARSAFFLLDGYVKGIAYDVLINSEAEDLSDEEQTLLSERDHARGRPRLLSLRDKLLQYPKIALGLDHPPLQESNCSEMNFLLQKEESLRHRLVHPVSLREESYFQLSTKDVEEVIDATISLIKQLSRILGEKFGKVGVWLYDRGSDGRFPQDAFD